MATVSDSSRCPWLCGRHKTVADSHFEIDGKHQRKYPLHLQKYSVVTIFVVTIRLQQIVFHRVTLKLSRLIYDKFYLRTQ